MDFVGSKENKLSASRVMKDNSLVGVDPPGLATSLIPRPPPFFVLRFCIQYNTRKWKSAKNGEGLVSFITCVTSGGREVDAKMT